MARYIVQTKFVFDGVFEVEAKNREEARKMVNENCGLTIMHGIHTNLEDGQVSWFFESHPQKIVSRPFLFKDKEEL